jgi:signal peptidase II
VPSRARVQGASSLRELKRASLILPAVAVLILLADQVTKYLVRANLSHGQSVELARWLSPFFRITFVTNSGAAFGLFPSWGQFFVVVAVIVIVALVWYYLRLSDGHWPIQMALGLQLGGATGNLVDRLRSGGSVVDFIDLSFWPLDRWPVFNLADSSIVVGVALLTLLMFWEEWQEERRDRQLATAEDD